MGSQSVSLYYRHGDRYPGGRCDRDVLVLNEHKYGLAKALLLFVRGKNLISPGLSSSLVRGLQ